MSIVGFEYQSSKRNPRSLLKEYFQNDHGDWLAVDFKADKEREEISKHFGVSGIPSLIVLDHKGKARQS